jgi:hypothetical protein
MTMHLDTIPGLHTSYDPNTAIDVALEHGAVLMPRVMDVYALHDVFDQCGMTWDAGSKDWGAEGRTAEVVSRVDVFRALQTGLRERGLPRLNCMSIEGFAENEAGDPHVDIATNVTGLSVFAPLVHRGELTVYGDDWFNVSRLHYDAGGFLTREVVQKPQGSGLFIEGMSTYSPGDVLLLRHAIERLKLGPKVHSGRTIFDTFDNAERRLMLCLDHNKLAA